MSRTTQGGPTIGQDPLLDRFASIKRWRRGPESAPHKPLLLLLSLARIQRGEPRLMRYAEIEKKLRALIEDFGAERASAHPEYPFMRLQGDGLWELVGAERLPPRKGNADPSSRALLDADIQGGLREEIHDRLAEDATLLRQAAEILLHEHFTEELRDKVVKALGLSF
jgi:putative restriction endonuclease